MPADHDKSGTDGEGRRSDAEAVYAEHREREARGEDVDFEELCARYPEHDTALRVLHLAHGPDEVAAGDSLARLIREKLGGEELAVARPSAGRYAVRQELARGGMGVIYEVWDEDLGRPLAMKVIRERDDLDRFLNEARITGRLEHPGVIPVHELGIDSAGRPFFTMPLVEGEDLETVCRRTARIDGADNGRPAVGGREWSRTRLLNVLANVCETLAYAHSKGVIHRDLKPANIMVGPFGEAYVMDWGLAKMVGAPGEPGSRAAVAGDSVSAELLSPFATIAGTVLGTPAYMPPEQASGDVDAIDERSDIYSVGAILYQLLVGKRPYTEPGARRSSREVVRAVVQGPPEPIHVIDPQVPPELVAICEKAMARQKDERYATMKELRDDLRAYLEHRVVRAYRTGAAAELRKWVVRNRTIAATIAASLVLFLAGLGAFVFWQERARQDLATAVDAKDKALIAEKGALAEKTAALVEKTRALRHAEAQRLLAQSLAERSTDPTLALLLALESVQRDDGAEAENAVLAALTELRETRTLEHGGLASAVEFSRDGRRIVTAGIDGTVRIWDVDTGEELVRCPADEPVHNVAFSADGSRIFVASLLGRQLLVLDTGTGRALARLRFHDRVNRLTLSPDGDRLAAATWDGLVTLLDPERLTRLGSFPAHEGIIHSVQFHPDGRRILVAGKRGRVWDSSTGKPVGAEIPESLFARFSPDGRFIATAAPDSRVHLIDAETGRILGSLEGHQHWVHDIAFHPDGQCLVTVARDTTARIWSLSELFKGGSAAPLAVLNAHGGDVMEVDFSPDGARFVTISYDGTARMWSMAPLLERNLSYAALPTAAPLVSPDGARSLRWRGREIEIWDLPAAPPGRWSAAELSLTLTGHHATVNTAAFSRDGRRVISGASDGCRIWDAATGETLVTFGDDAGFVMSVSFDRDGERVLRSTTGGDASVHDAATGDLLTSVSYDNNLDYASFSESGEWVVTGDHNSCVTVWDAATGAMRWTARLDGWGLFVGFFDDDRKVIAGSHRNSAYILDAESGRVIRRLVGHESRVVGAAFHPATGLVVTSARDGTARVWDVKTGDERLGLGCPEGDFRFLAFNTAGSCVYTLSGVCTLRAWPLDPITVGRDAKSRDLTDSERARFGVEESSSHCRARRIDRAKRDCDIAERERHRRPDDGRTRDYYVACLKALIQETKRQPVGFPSSIITHLAKLEREVFATEASETGELAEALSRLQDEARSAAADWQELLLIAAAQRFAGAHRDALETLERAARRPDATGRGGGSAEVRSQLELARARLLPEFASYASIDAALEQNRELLVPLGAQWRFFRGRSEPSEASTQRGGPAWTEGTFDDTDWELGRSGFGYEDQDDRTVLEDMRNTYSSLYVRHKLVLESPDRFERLVLAVRADDGFIAYLNGREVARLRSGAPGTFVPFDGVADAAAPEPLVEHTFPIELPVAEAGEIVLAVHGLNRSKESSDFSLAVRLWGELRKDHAHRSLVDSLRQHAKGPDARSRIAYLEGRLLQGEGRLRDAVGRFEESIASYGLRPEPYLRHAECLVQLDTPEIAEVHLRQALEERHAGGQARDIVDGDLLWEAWLRCNFVDLGRDGAEVLAVLSRVGGADRTRPGARVKALVTGLASDRAVRINSGGKQHVSAAGTVWLEDCFYTAGYRYFGDRQGAAAQPFQGDIGGTEDDPLYRTERFFPATGPGLGYSIPLPRGRYDVVLHFAEIYGGADASWRRTFDIRLEGRTVRRSFQPREAGYATATHETFEVDVQDGTLEIEFASTRDAPKISAIEVQRLDR